jgi:hypothetical protein
MYTIDQRTKILVFWMNLVGTLHVGLLLVYTNKSSSCNEILSLQAPEYANEFNSRLCSQQHCHHQHECPLLEYVRTFSIPQSLRLLPAPDFYGVVDVSAADFVP